jgi:hypothetical protein
MDQDPLVQISSTLNGRGEAGSYIPHGSSSDDIFRISTEVADSYEYDTGWLVLEADLLHECVHWVRYSVGGAGDDPIFPRHKYTKSLAEVGDVFECLAYGFNTAQRAANGKLIPFGPPETLPTKKAEICQRPNMKAFY